jgi:AcrR family transcriptional regulator
VLTNPIPALAAPPALSNNTPMNVRKKAQPTDPRVLRSRQALGDALVDLLHEQRFDDITVQAILDRAGVGRATFYAHYRNKEDVLHSGVEQLFVFLGGVLDRSSSAGTRLVPVSEFLEHIREADVFVTSLRASGRLDEVSELTVAFVADMIKRRIVPSDGAIATISPTLLSRMLAAAFMEMFRWWIEQPARETPERMDAIFHALATTILHRSRYVVAPAPGSP